MKPLMIAFFIMVFLVAYDNRQPSSVEDNDVDKTVVTFNQLTLTPKHGTQR